jgi:hypothetical protein
MVGACSMHAYKVFVGMPEAKGELRTLRCRWEDNIQMNLVKMGLVNVAWIHLAQHKDLWRADVNTVINLWIL